MNTQKSAIFDRELLSKDGETVKKVEEIIDIEKDTWMMEDKVIINHIGILKMRQFVGATFLPLQVISEPTQYNNNSYVFECPVKFPDGEISYEIGEASHLNTTGFSRQYKPTMAHKRGFDRAFLRSNYIGLFEVYSEEESDAFKRTQNQAQPSSTTDMTSLPSREKLFLPDDDLTYPNENIVEDILKKHKDFEYLVKIPDLYPDRPEFKKAVGIIMEIRAAKQREKQQTADFLKSIGEEKNQNEKLSKVKELEDELDQLDNLQEQNGDEEKTKDDNATQDTENEENIPVEPSTEKNEATDVENGEETDSTTKTTNEQPDSEQEETQ